MDPPKILPPEHDKLEPSELVLQLISSIRNLDGMLDILIEVVSSDMCKEEYKEELKSRTDRLLQTRFCLTYSLMDTRPTLAKVLEVSEHSVLASGPALYDAIKRRVR